MIVHHMIVAPDIQWFAICDSNNIELAQINKTSSVRNKADAISLYADALLNNRGIPVTGDFGNE